MAINEIAGDDILTIDPADISNGGGATGTDGTGDGEYYTHSGRKTRSDRGTKRGPRGASASSRSQKVSLDIDGVTALLYMIHLGVSNASGPIRDDNGKPIWEISEAEARGMAVAISNVARHYDISASQKVMDWGGLITVACATYLPRVAVTIEVRNRPVVRNATA